MLEMHSQQRVAHSQIVTLQKELRELRGHVAKTDATNARLPQPMELQAAMTLASEQLGEWSERTERLEARVQTDAAQVASELDGKAEKRLLFGKADKAYCENLLARFASEVATQLASVTSEVESSKAASRYELQTALQAAMGQMMDLQASDAAVATRVSTANSHISSHSPSRLTSRPGSAAGSRPTSATSVRSATRRTSAAGVVPAGMISAEPPSVGPLTVRMLADGRPPSGGHTRHPTKLKGSTSLLEAVPARGTAVFGEHAQGGGYSSGQASAEQREVMHTISESLMSASTAAPPPQLHSQRDAFLPCRPTSQPSPGEQELLMQRPSSGNSRAIKKTISASGLLAHG